MNKKYIEHIIQSNKYLILCECVLFGLFGVLSPQILTQQYSDFTVSYRQTLQFHSIIVVLFIAIVIVAYMMNKKYYQKNSVDVYGALPMKKENMFLHDYLIGYAIVFLPFLISIIIGVLGYYFNIMIMHSYVQNIDLLIFIPNIAVTLCCASFIYTLFYLACSIAKAKNDAIIFSIGYFVIMVSFAYMVVITLSSLCYTTNLDFIYYKTNVLFNFLTPLSMLYDMGTVMVVESVNDAVLYAALLQGVVSVIIVIYLYRESKVRQYEAVLQKNKHILGFPVIIAAAISYFGLVYAFSEITSIIMSIVFLGFGIFVYFFLLYYYNSKTMFKPKKIILLSAVFLLSYSMRFIGIYTNGFYTYDDFVAYDDSDMIEITLTGYSQEHYRFLVDDEDLSGFDQVIDSLDMVLEANKENQYSNSSPDVYINVEFSSLILGSDKSKSYTFIVDEETANIFLEEFTSMGATFKLRYAEDGEVEYDE